MDIAMGEGASACALQPQKQLTVRDVTRLECHIIFASSLVELKIKASQEFGRPTETPTIHFDEDGTEIDDEEYFNTLQDGTDLIAVFPGQHWIDLNMHTRVCTYEFYAVPDYD